MPETVKPVEWIEQVAVLKLDVPGFDKLALKDKIIAYHLWHAAVIGDAITYDQSYKHGLELRDLFLGIINHVDKVDSGAYEKIKRYTRKILLNHGIHDNYSTKKFMPEFTLDELRAVIKNLNENGIKISCSKHIERVIFDPSFEEMLTNKNPADGGDIVSASSNNLYQNVTLSDLDDFEERYPINSTVVKENGKIVERVWRAGNKERNIMPGLYAAHLAKVCNHLEKASAYALDDQKTYLLKLKEFLEEGEQHLFDDYNIHWVNSDPPVDKILGFIEVYLDARSTKGEFEGLVFIKDEETSKITKGLAKLAQYLENKAPWKEEYKKRWERVPIANAITVLVGTGGAGPMCMAGVNLPNSREIQEKHGNKSYLLTNVTSARRAAFFPLFINEFIEDKRDKEMMVKHMDISDHLRITLHEVVGHGSGIVSNKLKGESSKYLKENYSTMEEARAELCALHHIWDPKLRELDIVPDEECCKNVYLGYALGNLLQLRDLENEDEIHEDHMRARHLIISYICDKTNAIEYYKKNGKTYVRIKDYGAMRKVVAELLSELMRIRAEGDYDALKKIVDKYAIKFDTELRNEIVHRAREINAAKKYAYIMAEPMLIKDNAGKIVDVALNHSKDLIEQGLRWQEVEKESLRL